MVSCSPIPHSLAGIAQPLFGNQWTRGQVGLETSLKWRAGDSTHRRFDAFLRRSRRCAIDNVIVTIHCNARWNDNIFFQLSSKVKVLATAGKDLSADNQNSRWGTRVGFFCCWSRRLHMTFFFFLALSFFFFFLREALRARSKRSGNAPCSHRLPFITVASVWRLNSLFLFPVRLV